MRPSWRALSAERLPLCPGRPLAGRRLDSGERRLLAAASAAVLLSNNLRQPGL